MDYLEYTMRRWMQVYTYAACWKHKRTWRIFPDNPIYQTIQHKREPIFQDNPSISPTFSYIALGSQNTIHLVNSSLWVDANTLWYVSPILIQGSSGQERWITNQGSSVVTGPQNIDINYYHQFQISFNIITSDSSVIPTPIHLTARAFGT